MKQRILIDQDHVLADLITPWIQRYNSLYDDCIKVSDVTTWDWHEKTKCGLLLYDILLSPELFENLPVIENAQEVVKELCDYFDVYVVTAARNASIIPSKSNWLKKHFPFIKKERHIYAYDKSVVMGDYLIDDKPENLATSPATVKILFDAGHNQNEQRFTRALDWKHVRKLLI